ncbi:MAG: SDR family oxidoreductase [Mesorhizobium sp.]|nr:SDR family oxidoreductase [Mesorhizobium sp.]
MMDLGLAGRKALVAGATRGMGLETARLLAREGAQVFGLARDEAALAALSCETGGAHCVADLTSAQSVDDAVAAAVRHYGPPDILIVSAGAAQGGVVWEIPDSVWHDALELKLMGMVRLFRAVAPLMVRAGQGRIVAIVGNNGRQPNARLAPGSAANAACLAVVRALAEEVAPHGVTVNALNPGPTRTDRWHKMIAGLAAAEGRAFEEVEAEQLASMPKGRIGEAHEMARLAVILASDLADMVTGTSLTADGGITKGLP